MFSRSACLALLLCACVLGAGCAGNGPPSASATPPPTTPGTVRFDTIQTTIFNVRCLSAGCHNSSDRAGNLVLVAGASYASLINVAPFNPAAQTRGLLRVIPGDTEHSFLLIKLTGPPSDEGSRMPLTPPQLSAADIKLVRDWILAGAPGPNAPTAAPAATSSPTSTPTPLDTATSIPTATLTGTPAFTPTGTLPSTPSPTPTQPPTATHPPTATQSPTATQPPTATVSPTASPTQILTPTFSLASTFPQIQTTIFTPTCLDLSCHTATDKAGSLVLEDSAAYSNLVGVTPVNVAASRAGMVRVEPGDPASSFLITKVTLPKVFDLQFASRMPSGKPMLSMQQIDSIRAWILRGALVDENAPAQ